MTNQDHAWDRYVPAASLMEPGEDPITPVTGLRTTDTTRVVPRRQVIPGEVIASTVENVQDAPRQITRVEVGQGGVIQLHDDETGGREAVSEVTADPFYVDLNAIADAVKSAQENNGQPADPGKRVFVGSEGNLLMGDEATGTERVAEVTGDTFYREPVNLTRIAEAARAATANGGQYADPSQRIFVNRNGELRQGSAQTSERVSVVTADPFYTSRLLQESEFVRSNMPHNTMRVSDGTYEGWHFTITNEFGDNYGLFLYYHPSFRVYRVALISPRMEGTADAHGTHLWPDGTLCLTRATGSGYPDMGATYAKAALWTRGASCYRRGYGFQFNVGQD